MRLIISKKLFTFIAILSNFQMDGALKGTEGQDIVGVLKRFIIENM